MRRALLLIMGACALALSSPADARRARAPAIGNQNAKPDAFFSNPFQPMIQPTARVAGIVPQLAAKVAEISAACGSKVISGLRHTLVAGTRTMSLHASGRAVDMQGNPGCIYQHLNGWPGGYTTDYGRMRHIHISIGGREDGLRFRHGQRWKGKHRHRRR